MMNLPDPPDGDRLRKIADDMIYLLSQDMLDGEMDRLEAMAPVEVITYFYLSSDCDAFAEALVAMAGGDIVAINSASHGQVHRLVRLEGGEMVDAGGFQTLESLRARYGFNDLSVASATFPAHTEEADIELAMSIMPSLPVEPFEGWRLAVGPKP